MKRPILIIVSLFMLSFFIHSCNSPGGMMKTISGKAGEIVVVIPKDTWEGKVGKTIRESLTQAHVSLPQTESIFDLTDVPPVAFKDIFKSNRNIITVKISSTATTGIEFTKDVWAYPQAVIHIKAKSENDFVTLYKQNAEKIISYFLKAEKNRLKMNYKSFHDQAVYNTLEKEYDLTLLVPPGFKIAKKEPNLVWIRYETPKLSQGLVIYTYPYISDDTFTEEFQLNKMDQVLKENVEGPRAGSYMTSEKELSPVFNILEINGNYSSEMRGLWRVENDYMGGPYLNVATLDAVNKRIVNVYGYVYCPKEKKRNYLREVETMIYSIAFPKQKTNDKINSEIKMGN